MNNIFNKIKSKVLPYWLYVHLYTDDDVKLSYEGREYGLYGPNLAISKRFSNIDGCYNELRKIFVHDGFKASKVTKEFLDSFIKKRKTKDELSRNQEYTIEIYKF